MTHSTPTQRLSPANNSDNPSRSTSTKATRTPLHSLEVVHNRNGWYINVGIDGVPAYSYGPLTGPISIGQAFIYVGTVLNLEN